jgi:hypothetical protein
MAITIKKESQFFQRAIIQRVSIVVGLFFILFGFIGIINPSVLGMHLGLLHNLIHLMTGALSLWFGFGDSIKSNELFCLVMGVFYSFLGLIGFMFGGPGYPAMGRMEADEKLLRIIPEVLEYGRADHSFHLMVGLMFLGTVYFWGKKKYSTNKFQSANK